MKKIFATARLQSAVATLLLATQLVNAQTVTRAFPAHVKRGTLLITQSPEVLLDGSARRLSPGARIRSTNNLIVMPATLTGQPLTVNYLPDPQGLIHDVWILSGQEAQAPRP